MKSSHLVSHCAALASGFCLVPLFAQPQVEIRPRAQFTSRVYFTVIENSANRSKRGRDVIQRQFADTFAAVPQFQGYRYKVTNENNELVFTLVTDDDVQMPFQNLVTDVVGNIGGAVRTKGGWDISMASLESPSEISLRIVLDKETGRKIQLIDTKGVPFGQLLEDLKFKLEAERERRMQEWEQVMAVLPEGAKAPPAPPPVLFGYAFPTPCATRQVTLKYGREEDPSANPDDVKLASERERPKLKPEDVRVVMEKLAQVIGLKMNNDSRGTFFFNGDCPQPTMARRAVSPLEMLQARLMMMGAPETVPYPQQPPMPVTIPSAPMIPVGVLEPAFP